MEEEQPGKVVRALEQVALVGEMAKRLLFINRQMGCLVFLAIIQTVLLFWIGSMVAAHLR